MERQVGICFMVPCFMLSLGVGAFRESPASDAAVKAA
jgi:hypothetical protein